MQPYLCFFVHIYKLFEKHSACNDLFPTTTTTTNFGRRKARRRKQNSQPLQRKRFVGASAQIDCKQVELVPKK